MKIFLYFISLQHLIQVAEQQEAKSYQNKSMWSCRVSNILDQQKP